MSRVFIIESEQGWGQKLDEIKEFATEQEAIAFRIKYNASNNLLAVPDWYMFAVLEKDAMLYGVAVPENLREQLIGQ